MIAYLRKLFSKNPTKRVFFDQMEKRKYDMNANVQRARNSMSFFI